MNTKTEFKIIKNETVFGLADAVNVECVKGWEPYGNIFSDDSSFVHHALIRKTDTDRPRIVCLCGSTRFTDAFQKATQRETMAGRIVLSVGSVEDGVEITEQVKAKLDQLHFRKIDLADEILVLNVGGYVGASTRSEIEYAERQGKPVRWLEGTT